MSRRGRTSSGETRSKTQRKRDSESLQSLGESLVGLSPDELQQLELPPRLREAIEEARHISKHGALRRQRQYIGRLMREIDPDPVRRFLERRDAIRRRDTELFHAAESWRRRLLEGGDGILLECADTLGVGPAELRQHRDAVLEAPTEPLRKAASRSLFRCLHDRLHQRAAATAGAAADLTRRPPR